MTKEKNFDTNDQRFLSEQLITCIGNKRALLSSVDSAVKLIHKELNKDRLVALDLFSGSGVVARLLKAHAKRLIVNDLEHYSYVVNDCHLSDPGDFDEALYRRLYLRMLEAYEAAPVRGIIATHYAPEDEAHIRKGERVFYTRENALRIDTFRALIDSEVPPRMRKYFLARLITEASVHTNTAGVFKGFYKDRESGIGKYGGSAENALTRIRGPIDLTVPILSPHACCVELYRRDANDLVKELKGIDLAYLDPPYDQHPYGSNYFMLNLILENRMPEKVSRVSGIPADWNRSAYNKKKQALTALEEVVSTLDARYLLISYNNEGFITHDEMTAMLSRYGSLRVKTTPYHAFRGSRNLRGRDIHTSEYLFILRKKR